ncbi:hypothetical protein RFI_27559 [Reticulomyxa filosa]|uniref:Kelch motif family protein n=1 Tax=Reticulomyxa filosa TaxID=46433 RepID=X6M7B1_RETFI|nr:hypothetical protein RFI_27559 [Reticulomyxa filosa]|eukprot:ETO09819.1 hypothetical protein RFI_27559 [Reticulomyxa filosa]
MDTISPFQTLEPLPISLYQSQCVIHKHEILICGGLYTTDCFSYHTIKNEYRYICSYPKKVILIGHCVVKRVDTNNPNKITLLSFGGVYKHTLIMNYVSVWDDVDDEKESKIPNDCNKWLPFTNKRNVPICIGRKDGNYEGVRALIGGYKNNLLFITYRPKNIDVFDLNTLRYVNHDEQPVESVICYHCLVLKPNNNVSKKKSEMILFSRSTGLAIDYDETNNTFRYYQIRVCKSIFSFHYYAYVLVNDNILFFGGDDNGYSIESVFKYSIKENKWVHFERTLPIPLSGSVGILSEDNTYVHILGGRSGATQVQEHMKTSVSEWMKKETGIERERILEEAIEIEKEGVVKERRRIERDKEKKFQERQKKLGGMYFLK